MKSQRNNAIKKLKNRLKDLLDKCSTSKLIQIAENEGINVPAILKDDDESSTP